MKRFIIIASLSISSLGAQSTNGTNSIVGTSLTLSNAIDRPIIVDGKVTDHETIPEGTTVTILQEYPSSYYVASTAGDQKKFFVEKPTKTIEPIPTIKTTEDEATKELEDILSAYNKHPQTQDWNPNPNDTIEDRIYKTLGMQKLGAGANAVPYVDKLTEILENSKKEGYYGSNDITKYYISLRPKFEEYHIEVKNQGSSINNTCTIFAMSSAIEYQLAKMGRPQKISIPFLTWEHDQTIMDIASTGSYYRGYEKMTPETLRASLLKKGGRSFEHTFAGLSKHGIVPADELPLCYMNSVVREGVSPEVIAKATQVPMTLTTCSVTSRLSYHSIYEATKNFNDLAIKDELRKGNPVLVGMPFKKAPPVFISSLKGWYDMHSILIVGFYSPTGKDEDTVYEFLNSWGKSWGNKGYGWVTSRALHPAAIEAYSLTSSVPSK